MRVGILGGTFDPPHVGHLFAALDAVDALALDRVVFIPAALQPLKAGEIVAPAEHRLAMTRLLVGDDPMLGVDAMEIERGGLSFTVDTLQVFSERAPTDERFLLLGSDVARTLARWREPERVARLATVAVLRRGDDDLSDDLGPNYLRVSTRRIDVSSSEIRDRVRARRSIRGFVPERVRTYIYETGLYGAGGAASTGV